MKKLITLFLALLPVLVWADVVTEKQARRLAEQFFVQTAGPQSRAVTAPSLRLVYDGESRASRSATAPAYYVYNREGVPGFVIISGDDRTSSPVLGYAFDQNFDGADMPANLMNWMQGIRSEIQAARASGQPAPRRSDWTTREYNDREPIQLLETALWDQRAPYNSKLPMGYVTGCPATAIAIIMRYHRWPEQGVGTIPESNDRIGAVTLGHTYDWDNMPLSYNDLPTDYQKDQVGTLMRDVGAMVRTQYGGGTAGAKPEETLPQLMPIYMRYNAKTIQSLFKKDYTDEAWHALMQQELDAKRPILYGGYSSGGGHQFVLDGYAADHYYHVNWGWSGVSNGYYLLTVMNPPEQGAGGSMSADGFTMRQDAIIGIQPDPENPGGGFFDLMVYKPYYKDNVYGMLSHVDEYTQGVEFQVDLKEFQNKGSRAFAGQLAIAHYAADGTFKGIVSKKTVDYTHYPQEINDFTEAYLQCIIHEPIEPGDYLSGVYKFRNPSEWTPIRNGYLAKTNCIEQIVIREPEVEPVPPTTYTLTLTMNAGGAVLLGDQTYTTSATLEVEENQSVTLQIVPAENHALETVRYNGDDVTTEVVDGSYTTPAMTAPATLDIIFADITGLSDVAASALRLSVQDGTVTLSGLQPAAVVRIYTLDGTEVRTLRPAASTLQFPLPTGQAYLLRVGDRTFKVVL